MLRVLVRLIRLIRLIRVIRDIRVIRVNGLTRLVRREIACAALFASLSSLMCVALVHIYVWLLVESTRFLFLEPVMAGVIVAPAFVCTWLFFLARQTLLKSRVRFTASAALCMLIIAMWWRVAFINFPILTCGSFLVGAEVALSSGPRLFSLDVLTLDDFQLTLLCVSAASLIAATTFRYARRVHSDG